MKSFVVLKLLSIIALRSSRTVAWIASPAVTRWPHSRNRYGSRPVLESTSGEEEVDTIEGKEESVETIKSQTTGRNRSEMTTEELMAAFGTSPRRIALSLISATSIALVGNFVGVTSKLLETIPESTVESTGLDTYYPRGDFKRIRGNGYTFTIPKEWVADTGLELAKAQRRAKTLDYSMKPSDAGSVLPDAAFGPPGRLNKQGVSMNGDTNVSVIVSKALPGFTLRGALGTPTDAAEYLLSKSLAPPGSGRIATLLEAQDDTERKLYQFSYKVDRGERGVPLQAITVIAAPKDGNMFFTQTVVAPQRDWEGNSLYKSKLKRVADSFHLTN